MNSHPRIFPVIGEWLAGELGCTIVEAWLPDGRWGEYDADTHTIYLRPDLGPMQRRSTLVHECGHAYYGHRGTRERQERQARQFAARVLVKPCAFLKSSQAYEDPRIIAADLGVMPYDVEEYMGMWANASAAPRCPDRTSSTPAGQGAR